MYGAPVHRSLNSAPGTESRNLSLRSRRRRAFAIVLSLITHCHHLFCEDLCCFPPRSQSNEPETLKETADKYRVTKTIMSNPMEVENNKKKLVKEATELYLRGEMDGLPFVVRKIHRSRTTPTGLILFSQLTELVAIVA